MNETISIDVNNLNSIIEEYKNESQELELVYNYSINEDKLKQIILFLNKSQVKKNISYILDVSVANNKNYRLSVKDNNSDIINKHCIIEKENLENNDIFPKNYELEYKELLQRMYLNSINSKLNLKKEYVETDEEVKTDFMNSYSKFIKTYRFKKRISYVFNDYTVDISIVKQASGQNIVLSNIKDMLEKIELEIEITSELININILKDVIKMMTTFNQYVNNGYFNINKTEKVSIEKSYNKLIESTTNKKNTSIGPKPLTFTKKTMKHMIDLNTGKKELEYKITEKADGDRYFMYINNEGYIYLLGNDNVLKTGLKLDKKTYNNSILDGELLYYKSDVMKYEYKYFDIYILNKNETYSKNLDDRIKIMNALNKELLACKKYINEDIYIKCIEKPYYNLSDFEDVLNNTYEYDIDGIIFMPTIHLSNIDNKSYKYILKYKQLEDNTIDVLLKDKVLYCGYNLKNDYVKSEIMCIKPYIHDIHKKPVKKYNKDKNLEMIDYDLLNNKVIEIVYSIDNDCFIFRKIRFDKTQEYLKTNKITANNFYIVNEILEYTFNNINIDTIKTISYNYIVDELKIINKSGYYSTDKVSRISDVEKKLRKIQNKIKTILINDGVSILENNEDFGYIKALDLACGRGGDLYKLLNTNFIDNNSSNQLKKNECIKMILGIDYSSVNIEYSEKFNNNARGRYLEYKNNHMNNNNTMPEIYKENNVYYITGDLNLYTGSDTIEDSYNEIMNNVKYLDIESKEMLENNNDFAERTKYDKDLLDIINMKHNIYELNSFEFICCQFAIHYFDLDLFCKYISMQLKPGGVFICTFMEKQFVEELFLKKKTDIVNGKFWSLRKSKTDPEKKIDVKFGTLMDDEYKEENLVSEELIVSAFEKYNIKLYNDTMSDIISNSSSIKSKLVFKDYINELDEEFDFNKLYVGLIFQKNLLTSDKKQKIESILKSK